jgi:hypothetical protein
MFATQIDPAGVPEGHGTWLPLGENVGVPNVTVPAEAVLFTVTLARVRINELIFELPVDKFVNFTETFVVCAAGSR